VQFLRTPGDSTATRNILWLTPQAGSRRARTAVSFKAGIGHLPDQLPGLLSAGGHRIVSGGALPEF